METTHQIIDNYYLINYDDWSLSIFSAICGLRLMMQFYKEMSSVKKTQQHENYRPYQSLVLISQATHDWKRLKCISFM